MKEFIDKLISSAKEAGIEAAEAYLVEHERFRAMTHEGEITDYQSNMTRGLGFRGLVNGRMGYASTEAFDEASIAQLIKGVLESAELCEDTDTELLYDGEEASPVIDLYDPELDKVSAEEKLALALETEKLAKAHDPRIDSVSYNMVVTDKASVRIVNTLGLDRSYTENGCMLYTEPVARDEGSVSTGSYGAMLRHFGDLNAAEIAKEASDRAVNALHAKPVQSGKYRVIIFNEAMTSLMSAFSTIFSAKTAQKGLSLLSGKLGEKVAADCVTLIDDPLMPDGLESRPFDAEGVPSSTNTLIDSGVFKTFLHNLKTALKDGVKTTGNASKAGYAAPVGVSPSNLYFKPGTKSLDELFESVGDAIVITEFMGLHAGANAVSGDFSLLSKGYTVKNGKRERPVEQITVAGNFYELLKNACEFANDLRFPDGGMGSPSLDAGELSVSGAGE